MKTIVKDRSLLIGEQIEDAQKEHNTRHQAKLTRAREIRQIEVSSHPDAMKKFGEEQVETCFSTHKKATATLHAAVEAKKDETDQNDSSKAAAKSKDKAKASDEQQSGGEVHDDGFKIPQGAAHYNQKNLKATECQKVMDRVLMRDLDPPENPVNVVRVTRELTPYGLSEIKWKYYLLYLVKQDHKLTLPQMARKLVKERRPKPLK